MVAVLEASVGAGIRIARAVRGWNRRELSVASGVSIARISRIESGADLPRADEARALWCALAAEAQPAPRRSGDRTAGAKATPEVLRAIRERRPVTT